jgi:FemAB-related protein (PEP-CTERM system-associated)
MTAVKPQSAPATSPTLSVRVHSGAALTDRLPVLDAYTTRGPRVPLSRRADWLAVLSESMGQTPYVVEATRGEKTVGMVGLMYLHSLLFGRFLVGLPYLNTGGVVADDADAAAALVEGAAELADRLRVRFLELRHEWALDHGRLAHRRGDKVHMRLELPAGVARLWEQLPAKVRSQVRKGQRPGFTFHWGGPELVDDFFAVFSRNMRDLGTPTYGRRLFASIAHRFPREAEFCVMRDGARPIGTALLLHGAGVTEVPSASTLKCYNPTCANMLLYWQLLQRSVERQQEVFDFGRSAEGGPTYRFKKQWGATPFPAEWQYYLRGGAVNDMRADNPKYRRLIAVWQRLPVALTRWLGPRIVRGIP